MNVIGSSVAITPLAGENEAMRLTLWTDYALRTLIYVGAKGGGSRQSPRSPRAFDISKTHLMKVVNRLGQQGYIDTVRGKGGGIRLARPPAEIGVGAVVRERKRTSP